MTIKDLARILVARHQIESSDAERFVQAIVEVINEGLQRDKLVKIKGFGSFKLQTVKERTSVNINTGEKVVIGEHYRVIFQPDTVMKDLVNKPFSQFETVVVNDDSPLLADNVSIETDNESIDADDESNADVDEYTTEESAEEAMVKQEVASVGMEKEETAAAKQQESTFVEQQETLKDIPHTEQPEIENTEESTASDAEDDEQTVVEDAEQTSDREVAEPNSDIIEEDIATDDCEKTFDSCRNVFIYHGILINILIAVVCFALGYLAKSGNWLTFVSDADKEETVVEKKSATPQKQPATPQRTAIRPSATDAQTRKSNIAEPSSDTTNRQTKPQQQAKEMEQKATAMNKKTVEDTKGNSEETVDPSKYYFDARVKTGAYLIVGTKSVVTARAGQTLQSISKAHLGSGMECYIEAYNGVKEVKAGDKIKIPQLRLKKAAMKKK